MQDHFLKPGCFLFFGVTMFLVFYIQYISIYDTVYIYIYILYTYDFHICSHHHMQLQVVGTDEWNLEELGFGVLSIAASELQFLISLVTFLL